MKNQIMLPKIKSKAFIRLLPQIFELREQGYSYEEVTAILEKDYGLILSVNQFSVYLARYKNATTSKVKKQVEVSPAPKPHQETKKDKSHIENIIKTYGFLSPEHKAAIQKETEENFGKSHTRVGLGLNRP